MSEAVFTEKQEREVHRIAGSRARRYVISALIGYMILTGGVVVAGNDADNRIHDGLINACERVNVLRAQSNISDGVSFNTLTAEGKRARQLATAPTTDGQKIPRATYRRYARRFEANAGRLTVTALTDCEGALKDPKRYNYPLARRLGDVKTGKLDPQARKILDESHKLRTEVFPDAG